MYRLLMCLLGASHFTTSSIHPMLPLYFNVPFVFVSMILLFFCENILVPGFEREMHRRQPLHEANK
eukprot:m.292732 g.292732  ORF g.292732 m.292732 type:complete len:66 (+) comp12664_c0_seq1:429-626(+)